MNRWSLYAGLLLGVPVVAYLAGVSDYQQEFATSDGDADLGFFRGFAWGAVGLVGCGLVVLIVEWQIRARRKRQARDSARVDPPLPPPV
jgi:hypothetical protein